EPGTGESNGQDGQDSDGKDSDGKDSDNKDSDSKDVAGKDNVDMTQAGCVSLGGAVDTVMPCRLQSVGTVDMDTDTVHA
ncbi:hypothetical protein PC129_g25398, partial [Phytophthora cactorum]